MAVYPQKSSKGEYRSQACDSHMDELEPTLTRTKMLTDEINYEYGLEVQHTANILDPRWKPLTQDYLSIIALLVVVVNDFLIKASPYAGLVSGKVSDFAGMYFLPFLLADLVLMFSSSMRNAQGIVLGAMLVAAASVVAIKLSPEIGGLCVDGFALAGVKARFISDPTDLFSLAMLPLAYQRFQALLR